MRSLGIQQSTVHAKFVSTFAKAHTHTVVVASLFTYMQSGLKDMQCRHLWGNALFYVIVT